ncbi:MAG: signal peptide peptidase SppA [Fulvimarina manganoxydans]|uniref:signal peptide peptidase SppA n=1 Tax=Fulvimarina manganoxydans TaxID=937218 RepID=UPI002356241D|nr:signal peptide peptidase SppA [Fulvimarina manganoxydans]MCK5934022.1 signal peptide peptidase SppA [Fulvimarina manganoxydans]
MASADDVIDRRALRRKVTFWRVVAVLIALLGIGALVATAIEAPSGGDQIARVSVEGVITEDRDFLELLDRLKNQTSVKAVIVRINSPGGTTVGGETIYEALRRIAEVKPVAAEVGTLAASAGYMVAAGTDYIVAHRTSIVGSIGVLFQYVDASKLLDTVGVDVNAIKSSPIKAEPSPFGPPPPEATAMMERLIMDTFVWFRELVGERRKLSPSELAAVADASVYSGHQGLERKLVDAIGGEAEVRRWLEEERGVSTGLEIVDRKPEEETLPFSLAASAGAVLLETLGLSAWVLPSDIEAIRLDGLVSLWQPSR